MRKRSVRPVIEKAPNCVLLADRHHGLAEGVRSLLETAFAAVVMVADTASLLEGAGRLLPDMAIVDLSLSRDGDLDWLAAVRQRCPGLKVIVLSVHDEQSVRRAAMEAGADAFVLKRAIATDLLPAIDLLGQGAALHVKGRSVIGTADSEVPNGTPVIEDDQPRDGKFTGTIEKVAVDVQAMCEGDKAEAKQAAAEISSKLEVAK